MRALIAFLLIERLLFVLRQFHGQVQLIGRQRARLEPRTKLIEKAVQDKRQRLQQLHRIFQFDGFLKISWRFHGNQTALATPLRQPLQPQSFLSEALTESDFGQRRQSTKIADPPMLEGFKHFRQDFEKIHRQCAQMPCFRTGRNDGDAGKSARSMDGGIGISGNRDIYREPKLGGAGNKRARDFCWCSEKAIESGDVEDDMTFIPSAARNPSPSQ